MRSTQPQDQKQLFGDFVYDRMIPKDHLLRRMSEVIGFRFVEQETRDLYSAIGRPGWSPIMLFKCSLIAFLYDIAGRLVETLIDTRQQAGFYRTVWNARSAPAGCLSLPDGSGRI